MTKLTKEESDIFDAFCTVMRANLEANAHKGGWSKDQADQLLARVKEELAELEKELAYGSSGAIPQRIASEAADVALMVMMVADVATRDRKGHPRLLDVAQSIKSADEKTSCVKKTRQKLQCSFCGNYLCGEVQYSIHRDGFDNGPEVPLCVDCGAHATPTLDEIWARISQEKSKP